MHNNVDSSSCKRTRPCLKRKCKNPDIDLTTSKQSKPQPISVPEENINIQQSTFIEDLPNEILGQILNQVSFADLFNLEKVNKRLRDAVLRVAWPNRNTLSSEAINQFTEQSLIKTKKARKNNIKLTIKLTKAVFSRTSIRHVDFSDLSRNLGKHYDRFSQLFSMTPKLISLNLLFIPSQLWKSDFFNVAKFCPLLEELSLEGSVGYKMFPVELEEGIKKTFIKCANLKYLNFADNVKLKGTTCFANIPIQLRYLNIAGCFDITSEAMTHLTSRAKNLETLIVNFDENNPNFNGWINNFAKLKFLEIKRIYENILDFSNLKELEMISVELISLANVQILKSLKNCSKLKAMDIKCTVFLDFNKFEEALRDFRDLKYLHFSGCKNVDNKLINLVQGCQLKYLSISGCGISADVMKKLLTQCNSLTHLELTYIWSNKYKAIKQALKEECLERKNVLKLVIKKPKIPFPACKWCEVIEIEKRGPRVFTHFTDVKNQYHIQKSRS